MRRWKVDMDSSLSLRGKLNKSNELLQKIALLKGEDRVKSDQARNNTTFFNAFNDYSRLVQSYSIMKRFADLIIPDQDYGELLRGTKLIKETFDTHQVKNPIQLQRSIEKLNERFKMIWLNYSDELTRDMLDQLRIFWQVCNNRNEVRDIINAISAIKEWPLTESNYKKYIDNRDAAEQQIQKVHFDKEIEEFLRKMKDRKATLLDLNDKILDWIRENNLTGNIMLSIKTM